jgi:hypothetical protein
MFRRRTLFFFSASLFALGCSTTVQSSAPSTENSLFDVAPETADATSILGIWETDAVDSGSIRTVARLELRGDRATVSMRCESTSNAAATVIVSTSADAEISDDEITISKSSNSKPFLSGQCLASTTAFGAFARCPEAQLRSRCFALEADKLWFYDSDGSALGGATKVHD